MGGRPSREFSSPDVGGDASTGAQRARRSPIFARERLLSSFLARLVISRPKAQPVHDSSEERLSANRQLDLVDAERATSDGPIG